VLATFAQAGFAQAAVVGQLSAPAGAKPQLAFA